MKESLLSFEAKTTQIWVYLLSNFIIWSLLYHCII